MGRGGNSAMPSGGKRVQLDELQKHDQPDNAWVAINGKVYDVSKWSDHPGGRVLYTAAGSDATDSFRAFHSGMASDMLSRFYVGELQGKPKALTPFEQEYRELIGTLRTKGMFKASILYYSWKFASTTALLALAFYVTMSTTTLAGKFGGAVLTALFWQQCGWLAHDFAHHQVFKNRVLNDAMVLIIGNLYQGFSIDWWKNKHNTHHAIPNLHEKEQGAHDGDPDIDTLPFLAWSVRLAKKAQPGGPDATPSAQWMVAHQSYLYFPILMFARLTWSWQSFAYAFQWDDAFWSGASKLTGVSGNSLRYPFIERAFILCHYAFFFAMAYFGTGNVLLAALWFIVAQTTGGILLAIPFGVGHNGMTVYDADKKPGFAELQITTTRNVDGNFLIGWFMGGLHLQIEHHLFPSIPRHNLAKAREYIEPLCKKHNIPYRSTSLAQGTWEVLTHLSTVAEAVKNFPAA